MQNSVNLNTSSATNRDRALLNEKGIIWWGRSDKDYSRNRILRHWFIQKQIPLCDFFPRSSRFGLLQAMWSKPQGVAVWVPCFRQRDMAAARKWCDRNKLPLIFDPLISAYDKQVFEKRKFPEHSAAASRLLKWERSVFQMADHVIADTELHANYFIEKLGVEKNRISVIPVSAEEEVFSFQPLTEGRRSRKKVLFFGTFLELHGTQVIAEAIVNSQGLPLDWRLIGTGPKKQQFVEMIAGLDHVQMIDSVAYHALPNEIASADIVLGIFGAGEKASRVIPNKVYQALAVGRTMITMRSKAYPSELLESEDCGIYWVDPGSPEQIIAALSRALEDDISSKGTAAYETYKRWFSNEKVASEMESLIYGLFPSS